MGSGNISKMLSLVMAVERHAAQLMRAVASGLNRTATVLDSSPLGGVCRSALDQSVVRSGKMSEGMWLAFLGISVTLVLVLLMISQYFSDGVPHLNTVPAPASAFDPASDPHYEVFEDDDVRPQLVGPDVVPSIRATNPATGELLGYVAAHTVSDVTELVDKAQTAQKAWSTSKFSRRRRVLQVLLNYILYEQKNLCEISRLDSGKTLLEACMGEIIPTLEKLRWLISEGEEALKPSRRTVGPMTCHKFAQVEYSPIGVIAAIAPWNYPVHNILNPVSAALFSGCSVIVKPSEYTAWSGVHVIRIVRRALTVCGEDPELVQCLVGEADVASTLVKADGVDKVFFTGSTAVGRKVAVAAAERLRPTCLELGGKDACIIVDDANLGHAVTLCLRGVFQNAGQNCIGIERVFVHRKVKEEFLERVVHGARSIRPGVDMGAMTMGSRALQHLESLLEDAVTRGAKIVAGGKRTSVDGKGWYFEATVLVDVTEDMKITKEETFGPILCVFNWSDDEKLIESVNRSSFGLGSSVFSESRERGDEILRQLKVGMCNINDFATNYLCQSMPFGGTKESGSDRFAGIEGLRGCCTMKSTTRDRFLAVKTSVPRVFQYPVGGNAMEFACEINNLIYGNGLICRVRNIGHIVSMLMFPSWRPQGTP